MAEVGERDGGAAGGGGGAGRAGGGCAGRGGAGAGRGRGGGRIGVIDYLEPAAGSEIGGDIEAGGGDGGGELAGVDGTGFPHDDRSEEHTSELPSLRHLVCRLLLAT